MSLLLRKATQDGLNKAGYTSLHTDIQDKVLRIVTKCGKPLVTVKGISFNKNILTNKEIEFATELFEQFLLHNKNDLDAFMTQYEIFHSLPIVELETKNYQINSYGYNTIKYISQKLRYTLTSTGLIAGVSVPDDKLTLAELQKPLNIEDYNAALDYLWEFEEYKKKEVDYLAAKAKLETCDI